MLAVFMALLVVSVAPVSAAGTNVALGSEHDTDTELGDATTLENFVLSGSGDGAYLELAGGGTVDSFEDGDIAEYGGDTGSYSVVSSPTVDGSYALEGETVNEAIISSTSGLSDYPDQGETSTYYVRAEDGWGWAGVIIAAQDATDTPAGYLVRLDGKDNQIDILELDGAGNYPAVDSGSLSETLVTGEYYKITIDWGTDGSITATAFDSDGNQIGQASGTDSTYTDGGLAFRADGARSSTSGTFYWDYVHVDGGSPTSATYVSAPHAVDDAVEGRVVLPTLSDVDATVTWQEKTGGTWSNFSSATYTTGGTKTADLSASSASEFRVRVDVTVTGPNPVAEIDRDAVYFENDAPTASNPSLSGGEISRYENVTLSVDVSDDEFSSIQGESVTAEFFVDGAKVGEDTASSAGAVSYTASGLTEGNHTWHVVLTDSYGGTSTSTSWSFEVDHFEPVVDNSSLTPADGSIIDTQSPTITVDVNDGDFAFDGDQLTAEFFVNNESVGTDTLTSNGTASYDFSGGTGGENTVYVRVTDQYGQTVQSQTNTFSSPSNLSIYNESNPTQLLTNLSEPITLRFYYENGTEGKVVERQTTNGTISLEGLPVDQSFVVVANAPGYLPRRIFVSSLLERQSVYLLPDSEQHAENLFTLSDFSGDYDKTETVLIVQRSLNGSWETVQGDYFGATGEFSAQLAYNVRHRLILRNTRTGQEKVVGPYTPLADGTKNIKVTREGDIELALDAPRVLVDPSVRSLSAVSDTQLIIDVSNQTTDLSSWSVEIVYQNETATQTLYSSNQTSATGGTVSPSLDLSGRAGGNVTVTVNWSTVSGGSGQRTATFIVRETFTNEYGLLPVLGSVTEMIPDPNVKAFTTFISIIVSVLVATGVAKAFPASTELVGVSAVGTLAFFSVIEWVGVSLVFVSGMTLIAFAALRRGL